MGVGFVTVIPSLETPPVVSRMRSMGCMVGLALPMSKFFHVCKPCGRTGQVQFGNK